MSARCAPSDGRGPVPRRKAYDERDREPIFSMAWRRIPLPPSTGLWQIRAAFNGPPAVLHRGSPPSESGGSRRPCFTAVFARRGWVAEREGFSAGGRRHPRKPLKQGISGRPAYFLWPPLCTTFSPETSLARIPSPNPDARRQPAGPHPFAVTAKAAGAPSWSQSEEGSSLLRRRP